MLLVCMEMTISAIAAEIDIDNLDTILQGRNNMVTGTCHGITTGQFLWIFVCRIDANQGHPHKPIIDNNNWKIQFKNIDDGEYFDIIALLANKDAAKLMEECDESGCSIPNGAEEHARIRVRQISN